MWSTDAPADGQGPVCMVGGGELMRPAQRQRANAHGSRERRSCDKAQALVYGQVNGRRGHGVDAVQQQAIALTRSAGHAWWQHLVGLPHSWACRRTAEAAPKGRGATSSRSRQLPIVVPPRWLTHIVTRPPLSTLICGVPRPALLPTPLPLPLPAGRSLPAALWLSGPLPLPAPLPVTLPDRCAASVTAAAASHHPFHRAAAAVTGGNRALASAAA